MEEDEIFAVSRELKPVLFSCRGCKEFNFSTAISCPIKQSLVGHGVRVADVNRAARGVGGQQDWPTRRECSQVCAANHGHGLAGGSENVEAESSTTPRCIGENGCRRRTGGRADGEVVNACHKSFGNRSPGRRDGGVIKNQFSLVCRAGRQGASGKGEGDGGAVQSIGLSVVRRLEKRKSQTPLNLKKNPVGASAVGERIPDQGERLGRINGLHGGEVADLGRIRLGRVWQIHRDLLVGGGGADVENIIAARVGRFKTGEIGVENICGILLRSQALPEKIQNDGSDGYRHRDSVGRAV